MLDFSGAGFGPVAVSVNCVMSRGFRRFGVTCCFRDVGISLHDSRVSKHRRPQSTTNLRWCTSKGRFVQF